MEQWGSPDQDHCLRSAGNLPAIAWRNGLYCNLALQRSCPLRTLPVLLFSKRLYEDHNVLIDITNIFTFHKKRSNGVWYFFPS